MSPASTGPHTSPGTAPRVSAASQPIHRHKVFKACPPGLPCLHLLLPGHPTAAVAGKAPGGLLPCVLLVLRVVAVLLVGTIWWLLPLLLRLLLLPVWVAAVSTIHACIALIVIRRLPEGLLLLLLLLLLCRRLLIPALPLWLLMPLLLRLCLPLLQARIPAARLFCLPWLLFRGLPERWGCAMLPFIRRVCRFPTGNLLPCLLRLWLLLLLVVVVMRRLQLYDRALRATAAGQVDNLCMVLQLLPLGRGLCLAPRRRPPPAGAWRCHKIVIAAVQLALLFGNRGSSSGCRLLFGLHAWRLESAALQPLPRLGCGLGRPARQDWQ